MIKNGAKREGAAIKDLPYTGYIIRNMKSGENGIFRNSRRAKAKILLYRARRKKSEVNKEDNEWMCGLILMDPIDFLARGRLAYRIN